METSLLVTLLAVAFAIIFGIQSISVRHRIKGEEKVMKGYFLLGLTGLLAKIAMADGRVTGDEVELVNRFIAKMNLSDAEKAMCLGNFITARRDGLTVRDHARRFLAYAEGPKTAEFLYDLLWRVSRADGTVDPGEVKLLAEAARALGLDEACFTRFRDGAKPTYDRAALQAAGVPPSLVALA